jgi:hypothetical protein
MRQHSFDAAAADWRGTSTVNKQATKVRNHGMLPV